MPANKVQFRERTVRRIIRAAQKEGAKSVTIITPDATITVSLAEPSDRQVRLDVLNDAKSERGKAYGQDAS